MDQDKIHNNTNTTMDKIYDQTTVEQKWYQTWEDSGYFKPEIHPDGEPYSIILPPPNANGSLHFGHACFTIQDILIRYQRMKGKAALWLPGYDHAGTETQFVFEKKLAEQGKSRFDYSREELFKMIWDFVEENKDLMPKQLRRMGFSLDWSRSVYTLDPKIVKLVYQTFKKLHTDQLVYRGDRLVNFCTKDGTGFSDLEAVSKEVEGSLYHIKFPLKDGGFITIATTRPETIVGDVAVMVNPKDARYKDLVGKTATLPIINREVPIIADEYVEMEFGTGAVKVTPNHDFNDFEIARKHNLSHPSIISFDGFMQNAGPLDGLRVKEARTKMLELLEEQHLLEKTEPHQMVLKVCYKCGTVLEPLPLEQWYLKVAPLTKRAVEVLNTKEIKVTPHNFTETLVTWLENLRDWNISRQNVWGMQIPAWKCQKCNQWTITEGQEPTECESCHQSQLVRDPDTFDTWFSSGQWPFATLRTTQSNDFEQFYPTSVMETGRDILFIWVSRMIMLGLYTTDQVPFKEVILHGLVNDPYGKKMSKSKGNVVSPIEIADQYGADAARMALVYGNALGQDQALSYQKLEAMRKFTNKLWNMGRFLIEFKPEGCATEISNHPDDQEIIKQLNQTITEVNKALDTYRFNDASEKLYEFIWHVFADKYIEQTKERRAEAQPCLEYVFRTSLELLHPFMPFITEELWQKLPHEGQSIMIAEWPKTS